MIQETSREVIGRELDMTEEDVREATDPRINVERRKTIGGPAPAEVSRMIGDRLSELESARQRWLKRLEKYEAAKKLVEKEIASMLSGEK